MTDSTKAQSERPAEAGGSLQWVDTAGSLEITLRLIAIDAAKPEFVAALIRRLYERAVAAEAINQANSRAAPNAQAPDEAVRIAEEEREACALAAEDVARSDWHSCDGDIGTWNRAIDAAVAAIRGRTSLTVPIPEPASSG